MKRVVALLPVLIAFQAGAPPALAWTWPADGPVLRPFVLGDDPYAAAQHRGVDVAAPAGAFVRAPASGTVSFAGTVPGGGRTVTIQTADGYSVTLVHLGAIAVVRGQAVVEGDGVGSAGRSGDPEHAESYVHLGVRRTADPNGYVDPLGLLPPRQVPPPPSPVPPVEQAPDAPEPPPTPAAPEAPAPAPEVPAPAPEVPAPPPALPGPAPAVPAPAREPAAIPASERPRAPSTGQVDRAEGAEPVPPEAGPRHRPAAIEQGFELPAAALAPDASPPHARRGEGESAGDGRSLIAIGTALAALAIVSLGGLTLVSRRGDLVRARPADAAPPVLRDRAGRAAEDAPVAWTAEEDGLVADGDLERVSLGEPEPLPDLDRDDDPPELVQVPDDPGCRLPASATRRRFHHVVSRPPRHRRRSARPAAHSIR
jgi:Peptidase family M23